MNTSIEVFTNLYSVYKYNLSILIDEFHTVTASRELLAVNDDIKYIFREFGCHCAGLIDSKCYSNIPTNNTITVDGILHIVLTDLSNTKSLLLPIDDYDIPHNSICYRNIKCNTRLVSTASEIKYVMNTIENKLMDILEKNSKEFSELIQYSCELYPDIRVSKKIRTQMQFRTKQSIYRHYTYLYKDSINSNIVNTLYNTFGQLLDFIISENLIEYKYMSGVESYHLYNNILWNEINWSSTSLLRSLNTSGYYLPIVYHKTKKGNTIITDGVHRYLALSKSRGHRILGINIDTLDNDYDYIESNDSLIVKIPYQLYINAILDNSIKVVKKINEDGIDFIYLKPTKYNDLFTLYFILNKEINNFIDDRLIKIKPLSIITNKKEKRR